MRQVRLGQTELLVSPIALGTWEVGGDWGSTDLEDAVATIHHALELGINLFDTAQGYGLGEAERFLGAALWRRARRDQVVIATKGGLRTEGGRLVRDASSRALREGVESSLRNLGTEYIDIYHVHWPDPHTQPEETAQALKDLVRDGKIRHVGVSNYDVGQLQALALYGRVETLQPPYHLFHRDIESAILPYAAERDIGVMVYGPLAHGLLSGHMTEATEFAPDDWRSRSVDFAGERFRQNLTVARWLKQWAVERGLSLPQVALAWTLANPAVHVAIVGARHPFRLDDIVPAADLELTHAELHEIDKMLIDAAPTLGPRPEDM